MYQSSCFQIRIVFAFASQIVGEASELKQVPDNAAPAMGAGLALVQIAEEAYLNRRTGMRGEKRHKAAAKGLQIIGIGLRIPPRSDDSVVAFAKILDQEIDSVDAI